MNSKPLPFKKRENPLATNTTTRTTARTSTREKYTATMDRELRKRVKLASVGEKLIFSIY